MSTKAPNPAIGAKIGFHLIVNRSVPIWRKIQVQKRMQVPNCNTKIAQASTAPNASGANIRIELKPNSSTSVARRATVFGEDTVSWTSGNGRAALNGSPSAQVQAFSRGAQASIR